MPTTESLSDDVANVVVPMPTRPAISIKKLVRDDDPTTNAGEDPRNEVSTESLAHGVEVPIPTLPVMPAVVPPRMVNAEIEVVANEIGDDVAKYKLPPTDRSDQPFTLVPSVREICGADDVEICSCDFGDVVPSPKNPLALSKRKFEFVPLPKRTVEDAARPPVNTIIVDVEFAAAPK